MRFERIIVVACLGLVALLAMFSSPRSISVDGLSVNGVVLGATATGPSALLRELGARRKTGSAQTAETGAEQPSTGNVPLLPGLLESKVAIKMQGTADGGWVMRVAGTELRRGATVVLSTQSNRTDVDRLLGTPQGRRFYGGPCVCFEGPAWRIELPAPLPNGATVATLGVEFNFGDRVTAIVLEAGDTASHSDIFK